MKGKIMLFVVALTILLCSCATIFTGTKSRVRLDSNIESAHTVIIDGYVYKNVTFPFNVSVKRGYEDTYVEVRSDGYESNETVIGKTFNPVSIINIFNLLFWAVDAATGALTKPDFKNYYIEMKLSEINGNI